MGTVAGSFFNGPVEAIELTLLAFAVFFALLGLTTFIFSGLGHERALMIGLMVSQRNIGVDAGCDGWRIAGINWFYFALCQFPIYLSPQLLKPIVRKFVLNVRFRGQSGHAVVVLQMSASDPKRTQGPFSVI